jgi:LmbE family N-acetylglucosaminyl deacetylase
MTCTRPAEAVVLSSVMVGTRAATRLIVSPHLDDAVLSCWRALFPDSGTHATVVTVFGAPPPSNTPVSDWDAQAGATDSHLHGLARQEEDRRALEQCGIPYIHLDFVGGQYGPDVKPEDEIRAAIGAVAQGFEEVWLPAGIGGHRDHLLTARLTALAARGKRRVLYADMPYVLKAGWRTLIAAAEGRSRRHEWGPEQDRLSPLLPRRPPRVVRLSREEQRRKRAALECYSTQIPGLIADVGEWLDDPERFGWELSWDRIRVGAGGDPSGAGRVRRSFRGLRS